MGLLEPMRRICAGLPGTTEKISHGAPTFFAGKRTFAQLHEVGHHQNTFPHLWLAAPPGSQEELVTAFPERFFVPPYVGHRGWIAVRLDEPVDWDGIADLCREAWRLVATPKLVAQLARAPET